MPLDYLIELSWRLYNVGILTAEIMGWMGLLVGGIGYLLSGSGSPRSEYYFGLLYGGITTLICVIFVNGIYEAITYVMTSSVDETTAYDMYPEYFLEMFEFDASASSPLGAENMDVLLNIAGAASQIAAIIGMTGFAFFVGLWAISKERSIFHSKARKGAYASIFLMMMSISERIMALAAHVLITAIVEGF